MPHPGVSIKDSCTENESISCNSLSGQCMGKWCHSFSSSLYHIYIYIYIYISYILSIKNGEVPLLMKSARIKALDKNKGSRSSCSSYRPISILPILSKFLEKIVNLQLQNFIQVHEIITPCQCGFQKNKGTSEAL